MNSAADPFLSQELLDFGSSLRGLLASKLDPATVARWEAEKRYPGELMEELAQWGLHGALLPEDVGGDGGGPLETVVICEELSRWGGSVAAPYMTTVTACAKVVDAGASEPLRSEILTGVRDGRTRLAFALSEPGAGSDVGGVRTRAVADGEGWRISGEKTWCTGALEAHWLVLVARTSGRAGTRGLTVFLVPSDAPGLEIQPIEKLGHNAIQTCTVTLDEVAVGDELRLGERDEGWRLTAFSLANERLTLAAQGVGLAGRVIELSVAYAEEREQFGRRLIDIQAVAHRLAGMAVEHRAARLMTLNAAWRAARGEDSALLQSEAKLYATEAAMRIAHAGVQVHGGYGYATEYEVERHFRDAKLLEIVGGTSDIQRNLIAESLGATRGVFSGRMRGPSGGDAAARSTNEEES